MYIKRKVLTADTLPPSLVISVFVHVCMYLFLPVLCLCVWVSIISLLDKPSWMNQEICICFGFLPLFLLPCVAESERHPFCYAGLNRYPKLQAKKRALEDSVPGPELELASSGEARGGTKELTLMEQLAELEV